MDKEKGLSKRVEKTKTDILLETVVVQLPEHSYQNVTFTYPGYPGYWICSVELAFGIKLTGEGKTPTLSLQNFSKTLAKYRKKGLLKEVYR